MKVKKKRRLPLIVLGATAGTIVLANLIMLLVFWGKPLPNYSVAQLPDKITFIKDDKQQTISLSELGVTVDWGATNEKLKNQRNFFPILNLFVHHTVSVQLTIDEPTFESSQARMTEIFHKNPQPERVVFVDENFEIGAPEGGYQLDQQQFKSRVLAGIETGNRTIAVPTQEIPPLGMTGGVPEAVQALRQKLIVQIKLTLNGTVVQPGKADIGSWFAQDGSTMVFSAAKAKLYVTSLGAVYNSGNAALAIGYALDKQTDTTFVLATEQAPAKYTYCTATKGVDQSYLPGFIAKTAAVLGDPRGWTAGGKVTFERVESDCDFSLWLSAASLMPSFGGVCDSSWSCRSGRNVVINFDRWQGASDAWNASGGSLEDYRVMVTNHEVGHWLGFPHRFCSGPGQPAPVMQQQSIDLQGCKFNPWPTEPELTTLKQARGIAMLPAREDYVTVSSSPCCCGHCVG